MGTPLYPAAVPPPWNGSNSYQNGDVVDYGGYYWVCTQANTGQQPGASEYWQEQGVDASGGPSPTGPTEVGSGYGDLTAAPLTNPTQPSVPVPTNANNVPPMNILSLAANADRQKLASGDQWLILLEIIWNGEYIRLARNNEAVTFDAGDGFGPMTYQPFAFDLENHTPSGATLPTVQLKASNVNRMLQGIVEQYLGAVGATANLYVLNTANASGEPDLALSMTIMDTHCTAEQVTFSLGAPSPMRNLFPRFTYRANYCMWKYKSKQCGYAGSMPTCDLTLGGASPNPNGCEQHNNQTRFGAFPGIGTNGASIASQM